VTSISTRLKLCLVGALCAVVFGCTSAAWAELSVSGQKTFEFRDYGVRGDFSQFLHENPLFFDDRGFDQSLMLDITGTISDRVRVEISLDDTTEDQEDKKLLVSVDGRVWDATLGRLTLNMPDRKFLLFNRTVLGAHVEGDFGRQKISVMAGRPEGISVRNFFAGQGSLQEYVLKDEQNVPNPQVVQGSDVVEIDGRRMIRGADYTMDYEEGSVLFDKRVLPIEETSRIMVQFEVLSSGSTMQSTLLGFRHEFDMSSRAASKAVSTPEQSSRDYLAYTFLRESDDRSTQAAEITSTTPRQLTLLGLDGALSLPASMKFEFEGSMSRLNADTLGGSRGREDGLAFETRLRRKTSKHEMTLSHQRIEPTFKAIGREEFSKLGRDSDLVSDLESTKFDQRLELGRRIIVDGGFERSRTNLDGASDKPSIEFDQHRAGVLWKGMAEESIDLRHLYERSEREEGASIDNGTKEVLSARTAMPIGPVGVQVKVEHEDNGSNVRTTEDLRRVTMGLNSRPGRGIVSWGGSYTIQEVAIDDVTDLARRNTQAALNLSATPNRRISTDVSISRRLERNFHLPDTSRPQRLDVDTGEAKLRWTPSKAWTLSLKGSLEQRSRILALVDILDPIAVSQQNTEETSATIITGNPVLTFNTSDSLEWRPNKRWTHRLQYRERYEQDALTAERFSLNRSTGYTGKFAPSQRLRLSGEVRDGQNEAKTASTARNSFKAGGEAQYNLSSKLRTTVSQSYESLDDLKDDARDLETWTHGMSLERSFSKDLTASAGLKILLENGVARSLENALEAKVACTPKGSRLRWELGLKHGLVEGIDTTGKEFESINRRVSLSVDGRMGRDTRLEADLARIASGRNSTGGDGYRATTAEMKVSVDF